MDDKNTEDVDLVIKTTDASTEENTPPPASKAIKKTGKFSLKAIISTIIFLLLAGGAAAGFVYREQLIELVKNPIPSPTPVEQTITPPPDVTADWEEFADPETGLNFKYPFNYSIETRNAQNILATLLSPPDTNKEKTQNLSEYELKLEFLLPQRTTKTLKQIIEEEKEKPLVKEGNKYEQMNLTLGDIPATILTTSDSEVVYIINKGQLYRIVKYPTTTYRQQEFLLILSTIKFTDINQSSSNVNLITTCKSDALGITLTLPKGWSCEGDYILTVKSGELDVSISNLGRGGPCEGVQDSSECKITDFYKDQTVELKQYTVEESNEVFGRIKTSDEDEFMWISINNFSQSNTQKQELIEILKSIKVTK